MIIDIRDDIPVFLDYVSKRVAEQVKLMAKQKKPQPVTRIDFGFEFGQQNWVVLVFDTRPKAEPDGTWSSLMGKSMLKRKNWPIWHKLADDEVVYFKDVKGKKVNVMKNPDEQICKIVGDALKQTLISARDSGAFEPLTKAKKCELGVENLEGFYGWPLYKDRGRPANLA
jgi:hypothetical protein